jgi:diphosphomevalonate decarboxylase
VGSIARAHPNIALIKYWGKRPGPGNVPAAPSLSITLDTLCSTTEVREAEADRVVLNGKEVEDAKITASLAELRREFDIPPLAITTENNFPTAAGLASSASGFAALITAIDDHCELGLSPAQRAEHARRASGSAARSIYGGFVGLRGPDWQGEVLLEPAEWPLKVVIAITAETSKSVSSSVGMRRSAETSPFYESWIAGNEADYQAALDAVAARDFKALIDLSETSCLKMHGVMQSSHPWMLYWQPATVRCMHAVRELRDAGVDVFFTIDAGPQVKAVCTEDAAPRVADILGELPGVLRTETVGLGPGAHRVDA